MVIILCLPVSCCNLHANFSIGLSCFFPQHSLRTFSTPGAAAETEPVRVFLNEHGWRSCWVNGAIAGHGGHWHWQLILVEKSLEPQVLFTVSWSKTLLHCISVYVLCRPVKNRAPIDRIPQSCWMIHYCGLRWPSYHPITASKYPHSAHSLCWS